jgi:hypothetical protein
MNTTQIFTEEHLNHYLKLYLTDEIKECERRIKSAKYTLESDSDEVLPEDRTLAQRDLEIFSFRKFHLHLQLEQMDAPWLQIERLRNVVERKLNPTIQ